VDLEEHEARLRRRAIGLTVAVVLVILLIAAAVMVPAAMSGWRAYRR
jgi:hypothetical protein